MSVNDKPIRVWLRPLSFDSIGDLADMDRQQQIDPSSLIGDICQDFSPQFLENIRKRFWLLTTSDYDIFAVPSEKKKILEKLIWPLRAAKKSFILTDYLGCIALCGMACEMATIFLFDLGAISASGKPLSIKKQKEKFGTTFEKLGQERRIREVKGLLTEDLSKDANAVRNVRKKYLHFLTTSHSNIEKDAEGAYKATFRLIKSLVDLPISNGRFTIPSHLTNYLNKKKLINKHGNA